MSVQRVKDLLLGSGVVAEHHRALNGAGNECRRLIQNLALFAKVFLQRIPGEILVLKTRGQFIENDDGYWRIGFTAIEVCCGIYLQGSSFSWRPGRCRFEGHDCLGNIRSEEHTSE